MLGTFKILFAVLKSLIVVNLGDHFLKSFENSDEHLRLSIIT